MPSKTEKQKKFFGAVMGAKKGNSKASGKAKEVAKEMPKKEIKKFLKTEEDEQSISKKMKTTGKVAFEGPKVKERKKFAPPTKVESPKKGKGSYNRKETFDENYNIRKFIDCIFTKNYAEADKYIKQAVECKLQDKIKQEISTPLF
jgi:stalled ribosome alternative rescue factor ArfA